MWPFLVLPITGMFAGEMSVFWLEKCHNEGINCKYVRIWSGAPIG